MVVIANLSPFGQMPRRKVHTGGVTVLWRIIMGNIQVARGLVEHVLRRETRGESSILETSGL